MHFEIAHEFDIPLDAIELAFLSPTLVDKLRPHLANIGELTQKSHEVCDGTLERTWTYRFNVKLPDVVRKYLVLHLLEWDEISSYRLSDRRATWSIQLHVKPEWQKYFSAAGEYVILPLDGGRCKRVISGDLELRIPVVGPIAERTILGEVRKTFDAEAATLRDLATLV